MAQSAGLRAAIRLVAGRLAARLLRTERVLEGPARGSYTAVSRPPWFTALGLWPKGDAWYGGGLFVEDGHVWINGGHEPPLVKPRRIKVTHRSPYSPDGGAECLGVYFPRLRRDGWTDTGDAGTPDRYVRSWQKRGGGEHPLRLIKRAVSTLDIRRPGRGCYFDEHDVALGDTGPVLPLPDAEWADFDHRGRLVYATAGKLWEASFNHGTLHPRELADFNDMTFEAIASPEWARQE